MMIGRIGRAPSLVELYRRAKQVEQARRGEPVSTPDEDQAARRGEIVSPRDERGTPYPGDFPNDLGRFYRGCF